ncbi:putative transcription factor C2C2-CO-like family [Rosa chinensis]|uniref:Putative transcription factor C2C2-CO-like family n=1 Tax=Rosa chinensis TaxID=74649 RepID=A0A2P6P3N7_ROSCH|nr:zinc finger protein CONSTANS-LIKE 16 isoform X2 [Rosa chinensis]PRQ16546.1 putative transcription factor C2C2-CO-like family [Rosa chinensis]
MVRVSGSLSLTHTDHSQTITPHEIIEPFGPLNKYVKPPQYSLAVHPTLNFSSVTFTLCNCVIPSKIFSCFSCAMITEKKAANAMGGNSVRACDSCLVKRARWFCGADDAFLCQRCDASVHSANLLASRHERVRLKSASHKLGDHLAIEPPVPTWQQGVKRKARTPRGHGNHNKSGKDEAGKVLGQSMPFVPEIGSEEVDYCCLEDDHESEDLEQLLYRVPIFDPFEAEVCNNMTNIDHHEVKMGNGHEDYGARTSSPSDELDNLQGLILPSDMELAEFAADVENMLGKGFDEDCSDIKGLGLLDGTKEEEDHGMDVCIGIEERKLVKIEEEEDQGMECEFNPSVLDWNFDYDDESTAVLLGGSTNTDQKEEEKVAVLMEAEKKRKKICLRLNHEAVISAWASQGSPWTTGVKPELNPDDGWPDCMGIWGTDQIMNLQGYGDGSAAGCRMGRRGDNEQRPGREARVSRYREKRRTRLFSKKIRYEVRKLNAEKRPRMKGRFVKRTSFQMGMGSSSTTNTSAAPHYQQHQHLKK